MGRHPASAPLAHGAIRDAKGQGDLFVVLFRVFIGSQNNPGMHGQCLWRRVGSDELLKVFSFFSGQCNWIRGFGTSHVLSPPTPSLSSLVDSIKLGKHL
jgi:hypothetical protein